MTIPGYFLLKSTKTSACGATAFSYQGYNYTNTEVLQPPAIYND